MEGAVYSSIASSNKIRARILETASNRHIHVRRVAIVPKAQVQQARNASTSARSDWNDLERKTLQIFET